MREWSSSSSTRAERSIRAERDVLIVETRSGWICANAGIDASNVPGIRWSRFFPRTPMRPPAPSGPRCERLWAPRPRSSSRTASAGRGVSGRWTSAIGCAGFRPLDDWSGRRDREGRELLATASAVADEAAAAAALVRDKTAGVPAALIRGLGVHVSEDDGPGAASLRRAEAEDLFR